MHFHLASTLYTPEVQINLKERRILFRGACFPENAAEFFEPIFEFLRENRIESISSPLHFHLELTYLNSSARRGLWNLVNFIVEQGGIAHIHLYQGMEDDELEDYSELLLVWQKNPNIKIELRQGYYQA